MGAASWLRGRTMRFEWATNVIAIRNMGSTNTQRWLRGRRLLSQHAVAAVGCIMVSRRLLSLTYTPEYIVFFTTYPVCLCLVWWRFTAQDASGDGFIKFLGGWPALYCPSCDTALVRRGTVLQRTIILNVFFFFVRKRASASVSHSTLFEQ